MSQIKKRKSWLSFDKFTFTGTTIPKIFQHLNLQCHENLIFLLDVLEDEIIGLQDSQKDLKQIIVLKNEEIRRKDDELSRKDEELDRLRRLLGQG